MAHETGLEACPETLYNKIRPEKCLEICAEICPIMFSVAMPADSRCEKNEVVFEIAVPKS